MKDRAGQCGENRCHREWQRPCSLPTADVLLGLHARGWLCYVRIYGFGFDLMLELSDDLHRVETYLVGIGPQEPTCEETGREPVEVLASIASKRAVLIFVRAGISARDNLPARAPFEGVRLCCPGPVPVVNAGPDV